MQSGTIQVRVNGEPREVGADRSIEAFLGELGLHPRMIVVEHNRVILERTQFESTLLKDGDVLELVHFVGGG